ncbi:hypothetical protein GGX14DRAFT_540287 [Mycena pura]|uniref:Fucose-specific lectin n=1 Tax=Mycena pura TaxID=153505 RepID=A0AAD7E285_9AGAR|nr:hypothetical protein GGX14DRAFT_540287 [Mycena pura]
MPNGIAAIQWTDNSTSKSFKRIYTQQDDNKIYEFRWDSESLKWTRGNEGYSITPAVHSNTNIAAFKAETDKIILGCIGQDGSLRLKKFNAYDSGGGKTIYQMFAELDSIFLEQGNWPWSRPTRNSRLSLPPPHLRQWTLVRTGNHTGLCSTRQITTTFNESITTTTSGTLRRPLASGTGLLVICPWVGGDRASWPADYIDNDGWIPGASVVGVPWPPAAGQLGAFRLYLPDASGTMTERQNSFLDLELDTVGPSTPSPWDKSYTFSVGAKPMAVFVDIGGDGDRMVTVHTCSDSGKEIDGFFYHYYTWERTDPIQWDNLTM